MKPTVMLLCALLLSLSCVAQTTAFDVRKVRWGMSKAQVLKSEGKLVPKEDTIDRLYYEHVVVGYDTASISYGFYKGKLSEASYYISGTMFKSNCYLSFYDIDIRLKEKYGKPKQHEQTWKPGTYTGKSADWGAAVLSGNLSARSTWATKTTEVSHTIEGINREASHFILYTSKNLPRKPDPSINDF